MEIAIQTNQLKKQFTLNSQAAVHDLDLTIYKGQLFGLVGPDGAGKTTTLRMLSTVMRPTSGSAAVAGHDVVKQAEPIREMIGYMPQNFSLYPDLSVHENLDFFANIHRMPKEVKRERVAQMLDFTRLDRFTSRRAGDLSGGMKKKLALACALVHSPKVLLLDEPSTGVDPVSRRELWTILTDVVHQGVTIVISTPYMDEAERCHRVGLLYGGSLLSSGTPEEMSAKLPYSIIELKARPRKEMRRIVASIPEITEWRPVGDRLRLAVENKDDLPQKIAERLRKEITKQKLDLVLLRVERPGMEDVFVHLVNERRAAL